MEAASESSQQLADNFRRVCRASVLPYIVKDIGPIWEQRLLENHETASSEAYGATPGFDPGSVASEAGTIVVVARITASASNCAIF